jgi:acyl-ACP thioesterase
MLEKLQSEWRAEHMIRSYDVDPQMIARLPVLCRFMQEAAYFHAEHLGVGYSHLTPNSMAWVLARMRIEIERLPKWGETVTLRTWPSDRDRLFYYRDFEITDGDGMLLLLASTAWFVIDSEKRERIQPDWWQSQEYPFSPKVFSAKLSRLKSCNCETGELTTVNYGDLDQNGHVNNVRYIEWMLNSLPLEFHQAHVLRFLEVNYLAEAVCGHSVSICTSETSSCHFNHGIMADGVDLFRAESVWK